MRSNVQLVALLASYFLLLLEVRSVNADELADSFTSGSACCRCQVRLIDDRTAESPRRRLQVAIESLRSSLLLHNPFHSRDLPTVAVALLYDEKDRLLGKVELACDYSGPASKSLPKRVDLSEKLGLGVECDLEAMLKSAEYRLSHDELGEDRAAAVEVVRVAILESAITGTSGDLPTLDAYRTTQAMRDCGVIALSARVDLRGEREPTSRTVAGEPVCMTAELLVDPARANVGDRMSVTAIVTNQATVSATLPFGPYLGPSMGNEHDRPCLMLSEPNGDVVGDLRVRSHGSYVRLQTALSVPPGGLIFYKTSFRSGKIPGASFGFDGYLSGDFVLQVTRLPVHFHLDDLERSTLSREFPTTCDTNTCPITFVVPAKAE